MICPKCGFKTADGVKFCGKCGSLLASSASRQTPVTPVAAQQNVVLQNDMVKDVKEKWSKVTLEQKMNIVLGCVVFNTLFLLYLIIKLIQFRHAMSNLFSSMY